MNRNIIKKCIVLKDICSIKCDLPASLAFTSQGHNRSVRRWHRDAAQPVLSEAICIQKPPFPIRLAGYEQASHNISLAREQQ